MFIPYWKIMTLIIYSEDRLFADRRIQETTTNEDYRFTDGRKLFINPEKTIAMAVCGSVPTDKELPHYFRWLELVARDLLFVETIKKRRDHPTKKPLTKDQVKQGEELVSKCVERIEDAAGVVAEKHTGRIYVMSSFNTFVINGQVTPKEACEIASGADLAYGTGEDYFFMGRANGLMIPLIYEYASSIDSSISRDFNTICRSQLTKLPFFRKD